MPMTFDLEAAVKAANKLVGCALCKGIRFKRCPACGEVANSSAREEAIAHWEKDGRLDPTCPGCREFYESPGLPSDVFAPRHKASNGCESGRRPHCTCDSCF